MIDENGILKTSGVLQHRGGTYEVLKAANPLLERREIMTEVDTGRIKVGDRGSHWNDLLYTNDVGDKAVPTLSIHLNSGNELVRNQQVKLVISTNSDAEIEVISSDEGVVEIIKETAIDENLVPYVSGYFVHGVEPGRATITVRVNTSENYFAIEKSLNVSVLEAIRYGYRIKRNESDPYERVEYLYDAVGKKPAQPFE